MHFQEDQVPDIAKQVIDTVIQRKSPDHATLITFSGDLGAGKTTLIQEMGKQLGVEQNMQSPTFVIYKTYSTSRTWKNLMHGDMYRLESDDEILKLGWGALLADPDNIICIEWPEKILGVVPDWAIQVTLGHVPDGGRVIDIV